MHTLTREHCSISLWQMSFDIFRLSLSIQIKYRTIGSSHPEVIYKKGVLKNFLQPATSLEIYRYFAANSTKKIKKKL